MRARFADCIFDSEKHELRRNDALVDLAPKAFAMLEALIEARPAAVSKETLYEKLWSNVFVEQGNLHTLVAESAQRSATTRIRSSAPFTGSVTHSLRRSSATMTSARCSSSGRANCHCATGRT